MKLAEVEAEYGPEIAQEALDLALNDCQMWDNLPRMAQDAYIAEALGEEE